MLLLIVKNYMCKFLSQPKLTEGNKTANHHTLTKIKKDDKQCQDFQKSEIKWHSSEKVIAKVLRKWSNFNLI